MRIRTKPLSMDRFTFMEKSGFTLHAVFGEGEFEGLKTKMIECGGEAVILSKDPLLIKLNDRGQFTPGNSAVLEKGNPGRCHENAASNFVSRGYKIVTGFALSDDGVWRQHSWNRSVETGEIVESTVQREAYYGFELNDAEAEEFADQNPVTPILDSILNDEELREFVIFHDPNRTTVRLISEGYIEVLSRNELPEEFAGSRVWILENDKNSADLKLIAIVPCVEELETDPDESIKTQIRANDGRIFDPPIELCIRDFNPIFEWDRSISIREITNSQSLVEYLLSTLHPENKEIDT